MKIFIMCLLLTGCAGEHFTCYYPDGTYYIDGVALPNQSTNCRGFLELKYLVDSSQMQYTKVSDDGCHTYMYAEGVEFELDFVSNDEISGTMHLFDHMGYDCTYEITGNRK